MDIAKEIDIGICGLKKPSQTINMIFMVGLHNNFPKLDYGMDDKHMTQLGYKWFYNEYVIETMCLSVGGLG
jgi:hypothetical protein